MRKNGTKNDSPLPRVKPQIIMSQIETEIANDQHFAKLTRQKNSLAKLVKSITHHEIKPWEGEDGGAVGKNST
jgi:hypothetical protein